MLLATPFSALFLFLPLPPITQQLLLLLGKAIQSTPPIIRVLTTRSQGSPPGTFATPLKHVHLIPT
uniref:ORFII protein n=1 Tax=Simian T-lymphotropic virus 3 TaxID=39101 RepID=O12275_9DELA|nr:ORFII [Simian T-lymphotropic virus 3]